MVDRTFPVRHNATVVAPRVTLLAVKYGVLGLEIKLLF